MGKTSSIKKRASARFEIARIRNRFAHDAAASKKRDGKAPGQDPDRCSAPVYPQGFQLTLTLGLRYDFIGPFSESQGRFVAFDPDRMTTVSIPGFHAGDNTAITGGFVQASNARKPLPGVAQIQPSLVSPNKKDFAPRVGFVWQPDSNSTCVMVRGGYGIYFDRANSRLLNNQILDFPYYTLA